MLNKKVLADKIAEYEELDAQIKALEARQKAVKDELTGELERRNLEELTVGNKIVRWTAYIQNRFDSNGFKKANPDAYASWQKQVTGRRFSIG